MSVLYRALSRAAEEAEGAARRPRGMLQRVAAAPRWSIGGMILLVLVVAGVLVLRSTDRPPAPDDANQAKSPYLAPPLSETVVPAPAKPAEDAASALPEVATVPKPPAVTAEPLPPPPAPPQQTAALPAPSPAPPRPAPPADPAADDAFKALAAGRVTQALAAFETRLGTAPDDPRLLLGKAEALRRLGRREPALQAYQAALRLEPANETALADMMRLIGNRPRQALQRLLDIHAARPDDPGIAAQVGMIYVQLGELTPAMDYLKQAIEKRPNHAVYVFNLAVLQDRLGHRTEAIDLYNRALQLGVSGAVPKAAVEERLRYLQALGG